MNKLLSIVVPAYNMELYLEKTLSSCVIDKQEVRSLYEVIIVNDGSKDRTKEIAEKYVQKYADTETFILINKKNGGYGSAINQGLSVSNGKYFKVLDGDDWYHTEGLSEFVSKLENTESDIIITDYTRVYSQTGRREYRKYDLEKERELDIKNCVIPPCLLAMYGISYRTDIFKRNHIRITEHCFYTDMEYTMYPLPFVKTIMYYPINLYQYRLEREEQSVSLAGMVKHLDDFVLVIENLSKYFEKDFNLPNKMMVEKWFTHIYRDYIDCLLVLPSCKENKVKLKNFIKKIKTLYPERYKYMKNKKIILLEMSNYILYRPCCIWRRKVERK